MRKCPICDSDRRVAIWNMDFVVPDGWELPSRNIVCLCNCGMIYYDNNKTQRDYDQFYRLRYGTDISLSSPDTYKRLDDLVEFAKDIEPDKTKCIVDFGGGDGYVEKKLKERGYIDVHTVNVGDDCPSRIDLLISSNVFEHIYDMKSLMDELTSRGIDKFIIEVPNSLQILNNKNLPILDYHQKHINHFTPRTLNALFSKYGYCPSQIINFTTTKAEFPLLRVLYERIDETNIYFDACRIVESNVHEKIEKLNLREPIIIWGCGDICLHVLTKVHLNIVYFVDRDSAWEGQTIEGVPVFNKVHSNEPIVIIAQMQKDSILADIQKENLTNRVIVI